MGILFVCCSELTLDSDEASNLCIESWRTWYTLLQYGLAVDTFRFSLAAFFIVMSLPQAIPSRFFSPNGYKNCNFYPVRKKNR